MPELISTPISVSHKRFELAVGKGGQTVEELSDLLGDLQPAFSRAATISCAVAGEIPSTKQVLYSATQALHFKKPPLCYSATCRRYCGALRPLESAQRAAEKEQLDLALAPLNDYAHRLADAHRRRRSHRWIARAVPQVSAALYDHLRPKLCAHRTHTFPFFSSPPAVNYPTGSRQQPSQCEWRSRGLYNADRRTSAWRADSLLGLCSQSTPADPCPNSDEATQ